MALSISACVEKPASLKTITAEEKHAISVVLKEATSEPVLEMKRSSVDTIRVTTGFLTKIPQAGGGWTTEGSGHEYTLKKTKTGWEIQSEGAWDT